MQTLNFSCVGPEQSLRFYCQRMSNYADLSFSDEEVITVFMLRIIYGFRTLKTIHRFAQNHLQQWFLRLPSYVAFDQRLNQVGDVFCPLIAIIHQQFPKLAHESAYALMDAMPIIMAQRGWRFKAKAAPEIATANGYCATKIMHDYGVKLHIVALRQDKTLPIPQFMELTDAGVADRKAYEYALTEIFSCAD